MIKISANISKKVPIPTKEYSSQAFGASLEIELSDADKPEIIQGRMRELYGLLSNTIDEQIAAATQNGNSPVGGLAQQTTIAPANGNRARPNGTGKRTTASDAQCRCIHSIAKALNINMASLLAPYGVSDAAQLQIKVASQLIDALKSRQSGALAQNG